MLPNFLMIGPGKSGTTWLYHALKNHPQVCISSAKETLFFESEFERGIEWYSDFFSHCNPQAKAIGEVSNTYIFCRKAPERIKSINPEMKLISCLRNPAERTFSHYLFLVRGGQVTGTFREVLDAQPQLIEKGKYYKNLKPYFDAFNEKQFLIVFFEELKANQIEFAQSVYKFLNIDDEYEPVVSNTHRLSAAKPRSRWLALIAKKGALFMRHIGHPELISKVKYSSITKPLYKEYNKDEKPQITFEDKNFLERKISEDIEKLSLKLNMDLKQKWFN